jgi:hypothetical protein
VSSETLTGIMIRGSMHDEDDKKESRVKISAVEPGTFDGSDENFEKFKQSLCAYLGQAELIYVIRHKKSARKSLPGFEYLDDASTIQSESVYTLPDAAYEPDMANEKFKKDNMLVYNVLRAKCTAGPAFEIVKEHEDDQDGRTTWIKICAWYEGDSVTSTMAMQARSELSQLRFSDNIKFNNISTYISKFRKNMTILKNAGQAMTEDAYKQQFLTGITASDMQAARKTALAHSAQWSLETIINFMRMSYLQDKAIKITGTQRDRRLVYATRGQGRGQNRGWAQRSNPDPNPNQRAQGPMQGRGQARRPNQYQARGGRGRGRGRGRYYANRNNWYQGSAPMTQVTTRSNDQVYKANNTEVQQVPEDQRNIVDSQSQPPQNIQPGERFYRAQRGEQKKS